MSDARYVLAKRALRNITLGLPVLVGILLTLLVDDYPWWVLAMAGLLFMWYSGKMVCEGMEAGVKEILSD